MGIRRTRGSTLNDDTKSTSLLLASGLPSNPPTVSSSASDQENISLSWSAPTISGVSAITGYQVVISPTPPVGSVTTITGTTATVNNLAANTAYSFNIRGVNSFGTGGSSPTQNQATRNWNQASGGTETTYTEGSYTFRAHLFTGNSTITVNRSETPFEFVGGGGGGGGGANTQGGNAGDGGTGVGGVATASIGTGSQNVTVGGGGGGSSDIWGFGGTGGTTSVGSPAVFSRVGGGGGQGTSPQGGGGGNGSPNGPQVTNTYTGSSRSYSGGGGGGRKGHPDGPGSPGGAGSIAIRYRTGRV